MPPPLDTNVIIREIDRDDPLLSARAHSFLQQVATSAEEVLLTEGVLVEAVQVLSSRNLYNLSRAEIARDLGVIVELAGVRMATKDRCRRALDVYAAFSHLDFVDALLVAYAEQEPRPTVVSFDHDFDRIPGIERFEPALPADSG